VPFKFERLHVWQRAIELSDLAYTLVQKFPKFELFVLSSQLIRAANSVCLNIVEGSTGQTNLEFRRFLGLALRSDMEVVGCLFIAKRRGYISEQEFRIAYDKCEKVLSMLVTLRKSLIK
jgi:four helix bundle protein